MPEWSGTVRPAGTISACEVEAAAHQWHAIYGGPFGWTEMDADTAIQVCAVCGIRRLATTLEAALSRTIQDLRAELNRKAHTDEGVPE